MIVQIDSISKSFSNKQVLHEITLEIPPGEIFGFVGPDGAGKTTLLRTLLGLYLPDSGTISLFGKADIESSKNSIGYVPQEFSLNTDMTVWENIALFAQLQGLSSFELRAEQLLQMVWLQNFKDRLAGNLSGGMKQKLALVCGIIHNPKLLVLDEPTTGVDPVSRREFWQMLYRLNREGLTIIISTPYMDEVELCGKIAFLHLGRLKALGTPQQLLERYPYRLFQITADNLRAKIDDIYKLPVQAIYFKGDSLIAAFDNAKQQAAFLPQLHKLGFFHAQIQEIPASLEDLFSTLSENAQVQP